VIVAGSETLWSLTETGNSSRDQEKRRWVWDTELRTLLPLKQSMLLAGN